MTDYPTPPYPEQQQAIPGRTEDMDPRPDHGESSYKGSGRLAGKKTIVTGGDSGIGRAVAIGFAKEGADVLIAYLDEHDDANQTCRLVRATGRRCEAIAGDLGDEAHARAVVTQAVATFGKIDIVVSNAAEQHPQQSLADIDAAQLERTFRTNVFAMFYLIRAALPHLHAGARIITTTSVTAFRCSGHLVDYAATKGAIVAFTRSLAQQLAEQGILVNAVAPGPIWTPLIPSTFDAEHVAKFGSKEPLGRAGQPDEVAPCYIFLASADASYMTGQTLHPNGGEIVNG